MLGSKNILVCDAYNHTDPNIDTCTLTGLRGANIDTTHDFFVTNYEPNPNDVIIPTDRENIYSFIGRENSKYNLLFKHFTSNIIIFFTVAVTLPPMNFKVSTTLDGDVDCTWSAPDSPIYIYQAVQLLYRIQYRKAKSQIDLALDGGYAPGELEPWFYEDVPFTETSLQYRVTGLDKGQTYEFRVQARAKDNTVIYWSGFSQSDKAYIHSNLPFEPDPNSILKPIPQEISTPTIQLDPGLQDKLAIADVVLLAFLGLFVAVITIVAIYAFINIKKIKQLISRSTPQARMLVQLGQNDRGLVFVDPATDRTPRNSRPPGGNGGAGLTSNDESKHALLQDNLRQVVGSPTQSAFNMRSNGRGNVFVTGQFGRLEGVTSQTTNAENQWDNLRAPLIITNRDIDAASKASHNAYSVGTVTDSASGYPAANYNTSGGGVYPKIGNLARSQGASSIASSAGQLQQTSHSVTYPRISQLALPPHYGVPNSEGYVPSPTSGGETSETGSNFNRTTHMRFSVRQNAELVADAIETSFQDKARRLILQDMGNQMIIYQPGSEKNSRPDSGMFNSPVLSKESPVSSSSESDLSSVPTDHGVCLSRTTIHGYLSQDISSSSDEEMARTSHTIGYTTWCYNPFVTADPGRAASPISDTGLDAIPEESESLKTLSKTKTISQASLKSRKSTKDEYSEEIQDVLTPLKDDISNGELYSSNSSINSNSTSSKKSFRDDREEIVLKLKRSESKDSSKSSVLSSRHDLRASGRASYREGVTNKISFSSSPRSSGRIGSKEPLSAKPSATSMDSGFDNGYMTRKASYKKALAERVNSSRIEEVLNDESQKSGTSTKSSQKATSAKSSTTNSSSAKSFLRDVKKFLHL